MDQLFDSLSFFATGGALMLAGIAAALMVVIWDWRIALGGLLLVQVTVSALAVRIYGAAAHWAAVEIAVTLLCALILGLSAVQVRSSWSMRQSANWLVRLLAVGLFYLIWRQVDVGLTLPGFAPLVVDFFAWLAMMALLMVGLSDNPLFTAVALLLWFMPVHSVVYEVMPHPTVAVLIGGLKLLLALACSYLMLADRVPDTVDRLVLTDIVFPDEAAFSAVPELPAREGRLTAAARGLKQHGLKLRRSPASVRETHST